MQTNNKYDILAATNNNSSFVVMLNTTKREIMIVCTQRKKSSDSKFSVYTVHSSLSMLFHLLKSGHCYSANGIDSSTRATDTLNNSFNPSRIYVLVFLAFVTRTNMFRVHFPRKSSKHHRNRANPFKNTLFTIQTNAWVLTLIPVDK